MLFRETNGYGSLMPPRKATGCPRKTKSTFWLMFRFTAFFMLVACLQVYARTNAQEKITLNRENIPVRQLLKEIKNRSGYLFVYKDEILKGISNKNIHAKEADLKDVMDAILEGTGLTYSIIDKTVVLKKAITSKNMPDSTYANEVVVFPPIQGQVTDSTGAPLPNVTVIVKGTNHITVTDEYGNYRFSDVDPANAVLVFSFVGYGVQEVALKGQTEMSVVLKVKVQELEELGITVNTGYQILPKERATGSFELIDNKMLNQSVSSNILDRLRGTSSIFFDNGDNTRPALTIRGLSTINGPKDPLIILDNFPYEGTISNINPNDIESVTILKDAAATSIWGARAGNGVIVITTKKGKNNQPFHFDLNSSMNISGKPNLYYPKMMSSTDYIQMEQFLFEQGYRFADTLSENYKPFSPAYEILFKERNGTLSQSQANAALNQLSTQEVRKEYNKYVYQNSVNQQYALNGYGGSNNINYYISLGYNKDISNLNAKGERLTLRNETNFTPNKNVKFSVGVSYIQNIAYSGKQGYTPTDIYPYSTLLNGDGSPASLDRYLRAGYTDTVGAGKLLDWKYYPLEDYKYNRTKNNSEDLVGKLGLNYTLLPNLHLDVKYQYEKQLVELLHFMDEQSYYTRNLINQFTQINPSTGAVKYIVPLGGILDRSNTSIEAHNVRGQLDYSRSWNNHSFSGIAGGELRNINNQSNTYRLYGYDGDLLTFTNVDYVGGYPSYMNGNTIYIPNNNYLSATNNRFVSLFANGVYTYLQRYVLSASIRRDASNLFGVNTNNKWNPLWSVGGSWLLSKEHFYNNTVLPFLKFRATFGFSGNMDPSKSAVATIAYSPYTADYTNFRYATPNQYANPNLRWEKIKTLNMGVDFELKKNIITGSIEYYIKKGEDLYGNAPVDYTAIPVKNFVLNIADMKGSGWDITLHINELQRSLKWNTTLLLNTNSSKVTSYSATSSQGANYITNGNSITALVGKPVYSILAYRWEGLDNQGNPQGYLDGKKTTDYGAIVTNTTIEDLVYTGQATPKVFGSMINEWDWKGFSLSVNIGYKLGYYFLRQSVDYASLFSGFNGSSDFSKRWQKAGDEAITSVPAMIYPNNSNRDAFYSGSSILVSRADHIRLLYVNMGYSLIPKNTEHHPFSQLQFYINAANLGILWRANKFGLDPDLTNSGTSIPTPKSVAFGLRASF